MKTELYDYSVLPKMVPIGRPSTVCIRPLGRHVAFRAGVEYVVRVLPMTESIEGWAEGAAYDRLTVTPVDGCLRVEYTFAAEQEYYLRVFDAADEGKALVTLSVYALADDLFGRLPLKGDFHVHSFRSDGREDPAVVAANYRRHGFDFLAVTDHRQWGPSQEAIAAWAGKPVDLRLFHGEEVHLPENHIHIIHFGGSFSVNDLAYGDVEAYYKAVRAIAEGLPTLPEGVSRFEYASCLWAIGEIHKAGGMAVYCHPHWIANVYHVRDAMSNYIFETMPFDAFELLGGQTVHENNMQVALHAQAQARGCRVPGVGSSDSHGTTNSNWFDWVYSIVLAEDDSLEAIVRAVKEGYCAPVESYPDEHPRAHGSYRMVSYALFLLKEYFPLQRELCFEEGRAMAALYGGDEEALPVLQALQGRVARFRGRCFAK